MVIVATKNVELPLVSGGSQHSPLRPLTIGNFACMKEQLQKQNENRKEKRRVKCQT
jgi:hypothetical protein